MDAFATIVLMLQVKGLEFSLLAPHLLASGGVDGQLCIWDPLQSLKTCAASAYEGKPPSLSFTAFLRALHGCMISKSRAQSTNDCRMISPQKQETTILPSIVHHSPHKSLRMQYREHCG